MLRGLRRWRAGYVVASGCLASGFLLAAEGQTDWPTWVILVLAPFYALAAAVARRQLNIRATMRSTAPDPTPWTTQPSRFVAWMTAEGGYARHPGGDGTAATGATVLTKDRVGAGLAIAAAAVGLLLVLSDRDRREHAPSVGPTTSSVDTATFG